MSDQDDDIRLFHEAIGEVRRLKHGKVTPTPRRPAPRPQQLIADERRVLDDMLSESDDASDLQPGDTLEFARPGLQRSVLRKLKRGEYRISDSLDLHGLNIPSAREMFRDFLVGARRRRGGCVLIVHGKGYRSDHRGPVLKGMVDKWLRQRDEVLAFCSARPVDGGTGAVYVLLKSPPASR